MFESLNYGNVFLCSIEKFMFGLELISARDFVRLDSANFVIIVIIWGEKIYSWRQVDFSGSAIHHSKLILARESAKQNGDFRHA